MKGILLAGGLGTRLYPLTLAVNKQLLPIYDKPTIYYPLSVLMLANIQDILIISSPKDLLSIKQFLGDGSQFGIKLSYKEQNRPLGIAEAFIIGEDFIQKEPVCLILGDNVFYGHDLADKLVHAADLKKGARIFGYQVSDPERYGVVEFTKEGKAISLEEKPKIPKSNWAIPGLYFYDEKVCEYSKKLTPSGRGELEITDLNRIYLDNNSLEVVPLGRGTAWLDTGTFDSLLSSSSFIQTLEKRQGLKVACLEEIAFNKGWIDLTQLKNAATLYEKCEYGQYLKKLAE